MTVETIRTVSLHKQKAGRNSSKAMPKCTYTQNETKGGDTQMLVHVLAQDNENIGRCMKKGWQGKVEGKITQ